MQKIIIVTGTPGVGKTVLAKLIAAKTKSRFLNLGHLIRKQKLYTDYDRVRRSYIIDDRRLRENLIGILAAHRKNGLVIETHWVGSFIPRRSEIIAIVVRIDPILLARRLLARGWPKKKVWENVEAELIDLSLYESLKQLGKKRVYQVDATRKDSKTLLRTTLRLISRKRGWDGTTPNWLARYDPVHLWRTIL